MTEDKYKEGVYQGVRLNEEIIKQISSLTQQAASALCIIKNNMSNYESATNHYDWHPADEEPQDKDGWFLAMYQGVPIITHYMTHGFIKGVTHWMYINLPNTK